MWKPATRRSASPLVKSIPLRSNGFGIDPELTVKLAQRRIALYEVPISYHGRTYAEGKKIGFWDAMQALLVVLYYGVRRDIYLDHGARILDSLAQTPHFNRWLADTIQPYVGTHVLEIGAGIGNLSQFLAARRKSYTASDIDEEHMARLRVRFAQRPNLSLRRCDLSAPDDFTPIEARADTVICLNVLEHVEDDALGLRSINRKPCSPAERPLCWFPRINRSTGLWTKYWGTIVAIPKQN